MILICTYRIHDTIANSYNGMGNQTKTDSRLINMDSDIESGHKFAVATFVAGQEQ